MYARDCIESRLERGGGHYDLRAATPEAGEYCQEWRGGIVSPGSDVTPKALCSALGTSYQATQCPETDQVVAGCYIGKLGDGSASYHWYYSTAEAPLTAEAVKAKCGNDTFVPAWFAFDVNAAEFGPP